MKQTYEEASVPTNTVQEEAVSHSTVFDDVFRTIAQKMPQLLIPLINEVFHTNYSEDENFEQTCNLSGSDHSRTEIHRQCHV